MKEKTPSNKSFGLVFTVFFLIIGIYPLINKESLNIYFLSISGIIFLITFLKPKYLSPFNKTWMKFGFLLGRFINPIVMGIVFFFVVVPTGMFIKLFKKNYLGIKIDKDKKSYWLKTDKIEKNMKDQF